MRISRGIRPIIGAGAGFPLVTHASGHYLVTQAGVYFPFLGRNAWSVTEITRPNYLNFLNDTCVKGFNVIEIWAPGRYTGTVGDPNGGSVNPGKDGDGHPAFLKRLDGADWTGALSYSNINNEAPDLNTPNSAYFAFLQQFCVDCYDRGILVLLFCLYTGFPGTTEGWMAEMVANGATKCGQYGTYIANTFKDTSNIIPMIGGDRGTGDGPFSAGELTVHTAWVNGLRSVTKRVELYSAEWKRNNAGLAGSIATDLYDGDPINIAATYASATQINNQGERAYAHAPAYPSFLLESPFANGGNDPARRFSWWGWLSTGGGFVLGDFNLYGFRSGWESALNNSASRDHAVLCSVVRSIPVPLIPDQTVISSGGGTQDTADEVRFAKDSGSTYAVGYRPPAHSGTITIDRTKMSATFNVWKIDPVARTETILFSGLTTSGTQALTFSGTNGDGDTDWGIKLAVV